MIILGIDPGQTGAISLVPHNVKYPIEAKVYDWNPNINDLSNELRGWEFTYSIDFAILEAVHSMPKQGVSSMFKFGTNFGIWKGLLTAFKIKFVEISPRRWMKVLKKQKNEKTKDASLRRARELFPYIDLHLKKHNGRADALMMCQYAIEYYDEIEKLLK